MAGKQKQLTIFFFSVYIRGGDSNVYKLGVWKKNSAPLRPLPSPPAVLSKRPSSLKLLRRPEEWEEGKNLILERGSWLVGWGNGQRTADHLRRACYRNAWTAPSSPEWVKHHPRKQCKASSWVSPHKPTSEPLPQTLGNALGRE